MTTEEYAENNGWKLQPWSGKNTQSLQVWAKEFDENHTVLVGHGVFNAVVFIREGHTTLRTRRVGPGDFIPALEVMSRADKLEGEP